MRRHVQVGFLAALVRHLVLAQNVHEYIRRAARGCANCSKIFGRTVSEEALVFVNTNLLDPTMIHGNHHYNILVPATKTPLTNSKSQGGGKHVHLFFVGLGGVQNCRKVFRGFAVRCR